MPDAQHNTNLIPFQYEDSPIHVHLDTKKAPWCVLKDVCDTLGLGNPAEAANRLRPHETTILSFSEDGIPRRLLLVNESGLYRLLARSNKPEAEKFQDWVFETVLPTIRKTGGYATRAPRQSKVMTPGERAREEAKIATARAKLLLDDEAREAHAVPHEDTTCVIETKRDIPLALPAPVALPEDPYLTVLGYAKKQGITLQGRFLQQMGLEATKRCKEGGILYKSIEDERWGHVNAYPESLIDCVFKDLYT